jgi:hypothetical protein
MVRRRFDKYDQPKGLLKAYKHFVGHTNSSSNSHSNSSDAIKQRGIGEHELAAGLHKLGFQLTQHQVRVLLKRMSLDSSATSASASTVSAAEFSVFVRDPYHEDVAKKVKKTLWFQNSCIYTMICGIFCIICMHCSVA